MPKQLTIEFREFPTLEPIPKIFKHEIGNFLNGINKANCPIKICLCYKDGILCTWCKQHRPKQDLKIY